MMKTMIVQTKEDRCCITKQKQSNHHWNPLVHHYNHLCDSTTGSSCYNSHHCVLQTTVITRRLVRNNSSGRTRIVSVNNVSIVLVVLLLVIAIVPQQQQYSVSSFTTASTNHNNNNQNRLLRIPRRGKSMMVEQRPTSSSSLLLSLLMQQRHSQLQLQQRFIGWSQLFSSFTTDGSEYAAGDSDFDNDDDDDSSSMAALRNRGGTNGGNDDDNNMPNDTEDEDDENRFVPTTELQPVPLSKNAGNRFVTVIWDRTMKHRNHHFPMTTTTTTEGQNSNNNNDNHDDDQNNNNNNNSQLWNDHYDRIRYTEDHVMFCRKQNLYNTTFNNASMVDIVWSLPILSSDLQRVIGHAMCFESTELHYVQDVLRNDPIVRMLLQGHDDTDDDDSSSTSNTLNTNNEQQQPLMDISSIPIYRWRHIRDYSLRIDDGRDGYPCMCLALDEYGDSNKAIDSADADVAAEEQQQLRRDTQKEYLETLIRSERVIAAGPLHVATMTKDDPSSVAIGDFILFNAVNREDAVSFCEQLPTALNGLYRSMRVHFYNTLDVSGKFVSEDPLRDSPCEQMKDAMEYWGYPVTDEQTPWINR